MNRRTRFVAIIALATLAPRAHAQFNVMNKIRGQVRRTECVNNVREIGQLIAAYRGDHQGKMPKSLKALVDGGNKPIFVCPQDRSAPTKKGFKCSYLYVGPLSYKTPSDTIIVYDRKAFNHGVEGRTCLFYDGSVKAMPEADFRKLYKKQRAARKKRK